MIFDTLETILQSPKKRADKYHDSKMDEPFQNSNPEIENFTHLKVDKYLDFTHIKHKILQHQFVNYNSFRIEGKKENH